MYIQFRFPKHPLRRKKWIDFMEILNWQPSERSVLCSKHFTTESFDRSGKIVRLKSIAVPTIRIERLKHVRNHIFILLQ